MPKMIIGDDQYELTDSQIEFFKSLCRMIEGFNLYLESFVGTKNEESVVSKIGLPILGVSYAEIPKMEKVPDPIEVTGCSEQLPLNNTSENESDKLVLGKDGKSYIFNHDAIAKLVGDGVGNKQIAKMAGVNVITMTKYLNESGLKISKSSGEKKNRVSTDKDNKPTVAEVSPKKIRTKSESTRLGYLICPVCKKEFYPAPQHIYKNKKGAKVCGYTCARKSGGM